MGCMEQFDDGLDVCPHCGFVRGTKDGNAIHMEPGEVLLLCSDGLSNLVEEQELLYEAYQDPDREHACRRLINIANSRGGRDNITVVIIEA